MTTNNLTLDDALYGLRNLSVGDDEQTRISDETERLNLSPEVVALIDAGDFDAAYKLAIRPVLANMTRDDVLTAVREWARDFVFSDDHGDDDSTESVTAEVDALVSDMMNEYDAL